MSNHDRLADVARLIAEPARARIVAALMGGTALPATELALSAGVRPSTASEHLTLLVNGGFLIVERHGRHRYYRLADAQTAEIVEAIASFSRRRSTPGVRSLHASRLERARTCYDHLAGQLGVALTGALVARCLIVEDDDGYRVRDRAGLAATIGVAPSDGRGKKCLDWTERRHHCGGRLGAAIARALFDDRWIARDLDARSVRITPLGHRLLRDRCGVDLVTGANHHPTA